MPKRIHALFISLMFAIVIFTAAFFIYYGQSYYQTNLEERFYHESHESFKPSGDIGHGIGIVGSLLMIVGVGSYMLRKRIRGLNRKGLLKYWLELHIFLCTLGPLLVLFHTSFKFGGLVAISFWSMVAVFVSGVIGRFIYIQIPRSIGGRELSLSEIYSMKEDLGGIFKNDFGFTDAEANFMVNSLKEVLAEVKGNVILRSIKKHFQSKKNLRKIRRILADHDLNRSEKKEIVSLIKNEVSLNRKIDSLNAMQNIFKLWHVAHLPFALIMIIIMIIHIGVAITFGYNWIF